MDDEGEEMMRKSNIFIRNADIAEIDFIHTSLLNLSEEEGVLDRVIITKEELFASLFKDKIAECIIILQNDIPAGLALYSFTIRNFTVFNKPSIYIHDLYVSPKYRKQGFATQLKENLKTIARANGCGRIDFFVLRGNVPAIKCYDSWRDTQEINHLRYMRIKIDE